MLNYTLLFGRDTNVFKHIGMGINSPRCGGKGTSGGPREQWLTCTHFINIMLTRRRIPHATSEYWPNHDPN